MCVVYSRKRTQEKAREKKNFFPAVNIVKRYIKAMPRVLVVGHTLRKEKA